MFSRSLNLAGAIIDARGRCLREVILGAEGGVSPLWIGGISGFLKPTPPSWLRQPPHLQGFSLTIQAFFIVRLSPLSPEAEVSINTLVISLLIWQQDWQHGVRIPRHSPLFRDAGRHQLNQQQPN